MAEQKGLGFSFSNSRGFLANSSNDESILYTVEIKFNDTADICWESASKYLEMFGFKR